MDQLFQLLEEIRHRSGTSFSTGTDVDANTDADAGPGPDADNSEQRSHQLRKIGTNLLGTARQTHVTHKLSNPC